MQQEASFRGQLRHWSCGMIAACLLLLLGPAQATHVRTTVQGQEHRLHGGRPPARDRSTPDLAMACIGQGAIALISAQAGVSFSPLPALLACLLAGFAHSLGPQACHQRPVAGYFFRFRLLIFEHQIAINAP